MIKAVDPHSLIGEFDCSLSGTSRNAQVGGPRRIGGPVCRKCANLAEPAADAWAAQLSAADRSLLTVLCKIKLCWMPCRDTAYV